MWVLEGKIGERVVQYWPLMNSFFLWGVLTSVPILVKIDHEMRPWECSQTDRHTDRLTHTNRFYNLSHAICYSYGTDKKLHHQFVPNVKYNGIYRIRWDRESNELLFTVNRQLMGFESAELQYQSNCQPMSLADAAGALQLVFTSTSINRINNIQTPTASMSSREILLPYLHLLLKLLHLLVADVLGLQHQVLVLLLLDLLKHFQLPKIRLPG